MDVLWIVIGSAFAAGFIQGLTGFGSAIMMMAFMPLYFSVLESSAIVGFVTLILSLAMVWIYRKSINIKLTIVPAVLFISATALSILYAQNLNPIIVNSVFGLFLITLSIYFLFVNPDGFSPNKLTSFIFITVSGITNGLFSIGGPLMVIYYVSKIQDKKEYLGTIQFFFTLTAISSTIIRFSTGILTVAYLPIILVGIVAILAGIFLANQIVEKLDSRKIRQLTYFFIGLSGLYNLLTTIF